MSTTSSQGELAGLDSREEEEEGRRGHLDELESDYILSSYCILLCNGLFYTEDRNARLSINQL